MTGYKAYQGNQVEGAGPLGLVLLTYDVLYKSLARARFACESNDFAVEAEQTGRAIEALLELSSALNMEAGGDIAQDLARLYAYMVKRLTADMCSGSTKALTEVIDLVQTLREGWQQIADGANEQSAVRHEPSPSRATMTSGISHAAMAYGL